MQAFTTLPVDNGAMLNLYPDSMGGSLDELVSFLQQPQAEGAFRSAYVLPSLFNTDLDRGFSVIDYGLNELYATQADLNALKNLGIDLKLDFVLNHISVLSPQFQDLLKQGEQSPYKDFFIHWNRFWQGHGTMIPEGYLQPNEECLAKMFFRKPGLPLLMVRLPDGTDAPYWNTFYQQVDYLPPSAETLVSEAGLQYATAVKISELVTKALAKGASPGQIDFGPFAAHRWAVVALLEKSRRYLGQMDLNIRSPLVWEYYARTLHTLAGYGAAIVRLDAFAYAPKAPGERNFLNDPGTWELLAQVRSLADECGLQLLPEIHASYEEKTYETLAQKGYMTYDFFLPGLVLDAIEHKTGQRLAAWATELQQKKIRVVNMLGCHDGIPLLDLKGLLPEQEIQALIDTVVARGGYVKNLHGQKNVYYQVNATYYSALGESDQKLLLARALQLFMPGKPQVWYLDLFAGKNDHAAVEQAGPGGHKEINRTNLTRHQIAEALSRPVVARQLELLRLRNTFGAFGFEAQLQVTCAGPGLISLCWQNQGCEARLDADLNTCRFTIMGAEQGGKEQVLFEQATEAALP